jgi:hypothetical protein
MQRCGDGLWVDHALFQVENSAAMEHVEVPEKWVLRGFSMRIRLSGRRGDEVELHPGEEDRVTDPHDSSDHVNEAEDHAEPACDFGFHHAAPIKHWSYRNQTIKAGFSEFTGDCGGA